MKYEISLCSKCKTNYVAEDTNYCSDCLKTDNVIRKIVRVCTKGYGKLGDLLDK